jgi:hypothetical protein
VAGQDHASDPGAFSAAQEGTQIVWIRHTVTDQEKRRSLTLRDHQIVEIKCLECSRSGDNTLVRFGPCFSLEARTRDHVNVHPTLAAECLDSIELF